MPTTAIFWLRAATGDLHRPAERAVAADDEQDVDVHPLETVHDFLGILPAPRGAEDRAAVLVDVADHRRREIDHVVAVAGDEALVAVAEAVDPLHAVMEGEFHDEPADHVVDAGAEATAGDDPDPHLRRVEEDASPRARRFESGESVGGAAALGDEPGRVVEQHAVVLGDVVRGRPPGLDVRLERRLDPARAEGLDREVGGVHGRLRGGECRSAGGPHAGGDALHAEAEEVAVG
jgi:hypothetical protein